METVAFTQPSVELEGCNLAHSNSKEIKLEPYLPNEDINGIDDLTPMSSKAVIITKRRGKKQKCDKCDKLYRVRYRATHLEKMHSNESVSVEETYRCAYPACETKCKSVELLKRHFILHLEKNPYACNFPGCYVKCDAPSHLKRHMEQQHFEAPSICTKCGVTYTNKSLQMHNCEANINKLRSGEFKLVEINGFWRLQRVDSSNNPPETRLFSLPRLDNYSPNDKANLNKFIESLKKIDINRIILSDPGFIQACKDSPGFGGLLLRYHFGGKGRATHAQSTYKCSNCPTKFTSLHGFTQHKTRCEGNYGDAKSEIVSSNVSPSEEKPMQIGCPTCGKSFESDKILEKHLSQDHSPDEYFKCDEPGCGRYFNSAYNKQRHFQRLHMHQAYRCDKCKRCYLSQATLNQHLKEHRLNPDLGKNKTPPCDLCGKVLARKESLRRHMKQVHGITVPVPPRPKKIIVKETRNVITKDKTDGDSPRNTENLTVQVKIEPELIIEPDVVTIESQEFPNFDQVGKHETD